MGRIHIRPRAVRDLEAIALRIGEDNPRAADRWLAGISALLETLSDQPRMAPEWPHIRKHVRAMPYGTYIVLHRACADGIEVVRVLHGARDLAGLLEE